MKKLTIVPFAIASVVTVSLAGLAMAGEGAGHKGSKGGHRGHGGAALAAHVFERLDGNKDGQVTRAEADTAAQGLFARIDANKDGELTAQEAEQGSRTVLTEELEAHFKTLDANADGRLTVEESKLPPRFFERLDTNDDKAVTGAEFQAGPHAKFGHGPLNFKRLDSNKDGKLTRAEGAQAALSGFDHLDANRDGMITRAEIDARMEKKSKHHGKHKGEGEAKH